MILATQAEPIVLIILAGSALAFFGYACLTIYRFLSWRKHKKPPAGLDD